MATYIIVDKDKDPLGPGEIQAGETIQVNSGDIFIFSASANSSTTFESATGNPSNFEIRFEASNANGFGVNVMENLDVGFVMSSSVDLTDVDINADKALSMIMTAGDDVSLGKLQGSAVGVDLITIGNGFTTDQDINLKGGDNYLTIGDNATIRDIVTEDGTDAIIIGAGLTAVDINTGDGDDSLTIGDGSSVQNIDSGAGNDTIAIGSDLAASSSDPFVINNIKTGDGDDVLTIGDNASLNNIETGAGNDTVSIGINLSADDILTGIGSDSLTIGDGATLHNIDTKQGDDTISIGNNLIAHDIKTGDGADALTIGDSATLRHIETGLGDDTIGIGDNLIGENIKTDDGNDQLSIANGGLVNDIDTGKGNDTVSFGDNFTADKLETKDGDDLIIAGAGGSINVLDGGNDYDVLDAKNPRRDYPNATGFEIVCFARRTLIETENGDVHIEKLRVGDRVRTLNHGMQSIRWIGSTEVSGLGVHAPVRMAAGSLGNKRALWVSQQHRMFFSGWKVELNFGEAEVLVAAKHLVGLPGIDIIELPSVQYFHMLFDNHEIVFSEGIESESFHPGAVGLGTLSEKARAEVFSLFPTLMSDPDSYGQSARLSLKGFEAKVLTA